MVKSFTSGKIWRTIVCPEKDCEWSVRDEYKTASRKYCFHQKHKHKKKVANREQFKPNKELSDINGKARRMASGGGFSDNHAVPSGFNLSVLRGEGGINHFEVASDVNIQSLQRATRGDEEALAEVGNLPIVPDDEMNFLAEPSEFADTFTYTKKKKKKNRKTTAQKRYAKKKKKEEYAKNYEMCMQQFQEYAKNYEIYKVNFLSAVAEYRRANAVRQQRVFVMI